MHLGYPDDIWGSAFSLDPYWHRLCYCKMTRHACQKEQHATSEINAYKGKNMGQSAWQSVFCAGALLLSVMGVIPSASSQTQGQQPPQTQPHNLAQWDREAEETFGLGRGLGHQLMTQEEWQEHHQRMRQMTAQERDQYRKEWHARMQERAKEKGMKLPDSPGPHGMGPGGGRGRGRR